MQDPALRGEHVHPFVRLGQHARRWLEAPSDEGLGAVRQFARDASELVPEARRKDWAVLLVALGKGGPTAKQRARVQGLLRACRLFAPKDWAPRGQLSAAPLRATDPVDRLPGLGPTSKETLAGRGLTGVGDLVWTLPVAWDDLRAPLSIAEATRRATTRKEAGEPAERVCVHAVVKSASLVPMRGRRMVRVTFVDGEGKAVLLATWFFAAHGVLAAATPGKACLVVGRVRMDDRQRAQVAHPDVVADLPGARSVRPRYPRLGVPEATLRKAIGAALDGLAPVPDPVPAGVARREGFPEIAPLLRAVHGVGGVLAEPPADVIRRSLLERLAWAEALLRVLERFRIDQGRDRTRAIALPANRAATARLRAELRFKLTGAQSRAIDAIAKDLARETPMRRLLLGDVGTGKTAVALAAAAQCVAAGRQVAILAPTTVLAEQYMDAVAPLARATAAPIALVVGGQTSARRKAEAQIAAGKIAVTIGTHALLAEGVSFPRLGLVVVDEQHRLGVAQRLALVRKGDGKERSTWPHLLTLSATPIPRSMALALRGELATSVLDERPLGRLPVATELRPQAEMAAVVEEVRAACARGERAFWICPRIEDDDADEGDDGDGTAGSASAARRALDLAKALAPIEVALIHGAMKPDAKRRAMRAFRSGHAAVLVGTTVVEVGVDVPEATLMVVEGAEHFGLAQLHQLRGRVGRGERPGRCVLLHAKNASPLAKQRLAALCRLATGAEIAHADLALRGAGDLGGTRQSGDESGLLFLDLASPPDWLPRIEADARTLFEEDPALEKDEHAGLGLFARRFAAAIAVRDEAG